VASRRTIDQPANSPSCCSAKRGMWAVDSLRANTGLLMPTECLGGDQDARLELMADWSSVTTSTARGATRVALDGKGARVVWRSTCGRASMTRCKESYG